MGDGQTKDWVSGRGIMNTIVHEAIHDADPIARYMGSSTGRPKFGARMAPDYQYGPVTPGGQFYGVRRPQAGATARDQDLAAESMAYHGSYTAAPGKANLRILRHPDVPRSDRNWMLRGLIEARKREGIESKFDERYRGHWRDSPEQVLGLTPRGRTPAYIGQPMSAKDVIGIHATDTPETANFAMPKSQQIRRNLINAVNEMAMTRMTESGEFLEEYDTSPDQTETRRNRPPAARIKRMERETSAARRAINAHWKKIEAGKAPVPNSLEDLPKNVQRLIGQQQIRAELGLMRGRASEAIRGIDPANALEAKLREKIGYSTYRGDSEQRKKWDKLPFEEQEAVLRDYLTELSGMMREGVPTDRWGEAISDYTWDDDIYEIMDDTKWERRCYEHDTGPGGGFAEHSETYQSKCTGDKRDFDSSETGCDGFREARGPKFKDLKEEFPHIFNRRWDTHGSTSPGKFAYRGVKPGRKHRIVPHRYTPPPGIPEQDWLEILQWASGKKKPYRSGHQSGHKYNFHGNQHGLDFWAGNRRM